MKILILIALAIATIPPSVLGNSGIGPYLNFRGGINGVNTPAGRENAFSLSSLPDFGISTSFAAGELVSFGFDAGYSSYAYIIRDSRPEKSDSYKFNHSYIGIHPWLKMDIFFAGFSLSMPISANFGKEISSDALNSVLDVRIGAKMPLYQDESGILMINIFAAYMLTGIYSDFAQYDPLAEYIPIQSPQRPTNEFNPRAVSLSIGIAYLVYF